MSDREPASGLSVWIALRRAHQGGVSNLADQCWLDYGHRVPGYVADALDELTSAGLLTLGEVEPKACGVRRATVTDTGCAHYVALCQTHRRTGPAAVGTPQLWAHSLHDQRSHLLTVPATGQIGTLIGVCGHLMLWSVPTSAHPVERPCPTCQALPTMPVPGPQYRPPGEHEYHPRVPAPRFPHRRSSSTEPAPGGQPDPTPRARESNVHQQRSQPDTHHSADPRPTSGDG